MDSGELRQGKQNAAAEGDSPIAAITTATGTAGVCVIRVSGAGALAVGDRLVPHAKQKPSQRAGGTFFHARVYHPLSGTSLDDAVILVYRAPHSYTGEETVEIQGHGGVLPSRRLLDAALAAGARLAEPGEFTRRAFLNGRMDLTQAEAVCDFIQSKTERAAHVARAQLDGALGSRILQLYEKALFMCADIEHLLDFDEGELPDDFITREAERVSSLVTDIECVASSWNGGRILREGALVVISGRPNAGKSSLLNALLGCNRAIVHDVPGTTRDIIEEGYELNGIPLRLVDTAGLRETEDVVEREGISRARALMCQADVNLHLIDGSVGDRAYPVADMLRDVPSARVIICHTKSDLAVMPPLSGCPHLTQIALSVKTGEGLERLKREIVRHLGLEFEGYEQPIVSLRQFHELQTAICEGRSAAALLSGGSQQLVLAVGCLRGASEALGRIVGRVYSDDLLDAVFSRFCVGK